MFSGEFLGTMILITLGCGVGANNSLAHSKGEQAGWLSITTGWAMAVVMGVFVAKSAGAPQADLNPAVTFAKLLLGSIYTPLEAVQLMLVQVAGAFVGACLVFIAYFPHWKETQDSNKKLGVFATCPGIRNWRSNFLAEVIATMVFVLCIGAIFGSATMGSPALGLGPYLVGLSVWAIGLSLGGPTGYAINPARDLGPRLAHWLLPIAGKRNSDWGYALVPIVGPMLGAVLGAIIWSWVY